MPDRCHQQLFYVIKILDTTLWSAVLSCTCPNSESRVQLSVMDTRAFQAVITAKEGMEEVRFYLCGETHCRCSSSLDHSLYCFCLQESNEQLDDGWLRMLDNSNLEHAVPPLSGQLLQSLQADSQLEWESAQQAAGVMQQQRANQKQEEQQQAASGFAGGVEFMPADATPSFVDGGHVCGQQADTMQLDGEPHSAGAAAAAAALRITAAAAAHTSHRQNGPVVMQLDGPAAPPVPGWRQQHEQRLLDISMPVAAAAQLQEVLEQRLLLDLAADVAADLAPAGQGQQQTAALAEAASFVQQPVHAGDPVTLPAAPASSTDQGSGGYQQRQQPQVAAVAGAAGGPELDEQLGLEDLLGGQPQESMQQDPDEHEQLQLAAEQRRPSQKMTGSCAVGAVLADRAGRMQLAAAWDEEDGGSSRPAAAAGSGAVPELSALGVEAEAPPVLRDEPVVLLSGQAQDDTPGHTRMFW
jgi:hypothetical protein